MDSWLSQLAHELARLDETASRRALREVQALVGPVITVGGRELVNLASNDYLGLSRHPKLIDAAAQATRTWGTGSGASRLVSGHLTPHTIAEQAFARFKHAEAALLCPTGYMANLAVLTSLAGPGDTLFQDKLNHASLIDAARLSGATVRTFPHKNLAKLERLLDRSLAQDHDATTFTPAPPPPEDETGSAGDSASAARPPRRLIVTDSVFSMDGDTADLRAMCDLADRYDAILVVDEAHGTGLLGPSGAGLCEQLGVSDRVDVVISTASKALGSLGGIITARQIVIDTVVNRARSFIYTTSVPASQAAAISAALDVIRDEPQLRERLAAMARHVHTQLASAGVVDQPDAANAQPVVDTPIIPVLAGSPEAALALAAELEQAGFFAPAIRPPTVPPGTARVRLALRADLSDSQVEGLIEALIRWRRNRRK